MPFRPLGKRIVVERVEPKSPGGIIIPDTLKDKPFQGIVKTVGAGIIVCSTGDEVLFGRYAGIEIEVDGQKLILLREEEILGIIEWVGH